MNGNADLHVVLGASGGIGSAVVRELVGRGRKVRAVNRGGDADVPEGVERTKGDVSTPEGARAATAGAAVVYHCAQPAYNRWPEEFPPMNEAVIEGAAAAGAKLVFADNLYMYGPTEMPMTDATPERATSRKGRVRARMAGRLREVHREGKVRATMGRSSDYFGPRGTDTGAGEMMFGAAVRGKTVRWAGDLDVAHTLHYLEDTARGLVTLGEREEADGRAWILPSAPATTPRRFVEMVFAEAGRPAKVQSTSKTVMRLAGLFVPPAREIPDIWYQFDRPFVADASGFEKVFGPARVTPHEEAIARTVRWFKERA